MGHDLVYLGESGPCAARPGVRDDSRRLADRLHGARALEARLKTMAEEHYLSAAPCLQRHLKFMHVHHLELHLILLRRSLVFPITTQTQQSPEVLPICRNMLIKMTFLLFSTVTFHL